MLRRSIAIASLLLAGVLMLVGGNQAVASHRVFRATLKIWVASPPRHVSADTPFTLRLKVKNTGTITMKHIVVSLVPGNVLRGSNTSYKLRRTKGAGYDWPSYYKTAMWSFGLRSQKVKTILLKTEVNEVSCVGATGRCSLILSAIWHSQKYGGASDLAVLPIKYS